MIAASLLLLAATPASPPVEFFSSLEAADPPPTWTSTVDTDARGKKRAQGVTGARGPALDKGVAVTANGELAEAGEGKENLLDGDPSSKWLVRQTTGWVELRLPAPRKAVAYSLTSANDARERDPRDWTLAGSPDGKTWTTLDTQTDQTFSSRLQTREFALQSPELYRHYRLSITRNNGSRDTLQLAELSLSDGSAPPPPPAEMQTDVGKGPASAPAARRSAGFTGVRALQYAGGHPGKGRGYSYNRVFEVDLKVVPTSELSYRIFPELPPGDLSYASTFAAVDLAFSDGSYLSDLDSRDQHGFLLNPRGQGASKSLVPNQWNHKSSRIGAVAAGRTIKRILVAYDNPRGPAELRGWVDDIRITATPRPARRKPIDYVLTTRGTHASSRFSRGNNIPATAVPHGFNFWTPVTNAGTLSWLYEYHRGNNAENLPELQALAVSHQPSPWMGDRQTFQVMPSAAAGVPTANRAARALPFRHENEVAQPHRYAVAFENGMRAEMAPTDHAALLRFTFPGARSSLVFDNVNNDGALTLEVKKGIVTAYSDVRSGLSTGATRLFVYATFDRRAVGGGKLAGGGGDKVTGYLQFDTAAEKTVTMRIATSLISLEQAKKNLEMEIGHDDTVESVSARAEKLWAERLAVLTVEGASEDQLTTLYSNLYRLHLYPNSAHENVGTAEKPVWKHAVQSAATTPPSAATRTGAPLADGKVYVNNGFWDTYRTAWSAYTFFSPSLAGELVDGFVQQYKDGGWIARWSSPGYANLMTGTSSDVAFADAYVKGVTGFDAAAAYSAALRNATVAPPGRDPDNTNVGRKGLATSLFRGYTSSSVREGVSWALEGYINDFGIAHMARALAERAAPRERRRYLEEAEYFFGRAQGYVNLFDARVGFFQGRGADGAWKSAPAAYDPRVWGHDHDYTETDGWNFAFHAPHDGQGLANLYGGQAGLARKLDAFFSTPETAQLTGSYGGAIHEMIEARDVRMGQWGFSNQVSHHIPWMYDYAGQPWKTQEKVREALARLYVGSEIGQGYAGDEDNGETSAWYLFAALGLYPLQVGSPTYAIGSPLFTRATVHLGNGKTLVVSAPANGPRNIYVQGLKVNGKPYSQTYLPHELLAQGGELVFAMGPKPSRWGSGPGDAPPSLTAGAAPPRPLRDVTDAKTRVTASADAAALLDDTSATQVALGATAWVEVSLDAPAEVTFYTLTSGDADASKWVLKGSNDGQGWTVLDERQGEAFTWRRQTRPFKVERPGRYSRYRLELTGPPGVTLAELELLARDYLRK